MRLQMWLCAFAFLLACQDPVFTEPVELGGELVAAETLERGRAVYGRYCQRCHGSKGDGNGPAAVGQWPPPRDFRRAQFKFTGVEGRSLPSDEALERIVRDGLAGTAMLPWRLQDRELQAVVQYIKTFSGPGKGFRDPRRKAVAPAPSLDPFAEAERPEAIARGESLYHEVFQCSSCHPAYIDSGRLPAGVRREAPFDSLPKWSENYLSVLLPTDFLRHQMRSVRALGGQHEVADIYRSIAYGLEGPMPGFVHLGERDNWAVAHYVKSLADLRGTPEARERREALLSTEASSAPDRLQSAP